MFILVDIECVLFWLFGCWGGCCFVVMEEI